MRKAWLLFIELFAAALAVVAGSVTFAAERGLGAYWPGYRNFEAGVIPAKPGLYLRNDTIGYSATAPRVVINGFPVENVQVDLAVDWVEPMYVLPHKLFGATHAVVITQPVIWATLTGRIIGTNLEPSGSRIDVGDPVISPLYLGWTKGNLHYNFNLAVSFPIGHYEIKRVVNTSRNYWSIDPEIGVTYLNPKSGWDFSTVVGYSFNTENPATKYTSGQALHIDLAIGKRDKNGLKPGIIGYAWIQTTADTGEGAIFGAFKSRVYGIGPALKWYIDPGSSLMLRYMTEFGAADHLEGDQLGLTYKITF